jgi:flagellar biogenesis protein FliO
VTSIGVWIGSAALVIAGLAHLWLRRTRTARGEAIQLVATRYLGAKRFLAIVEVDGERLLLGLAGEQVSLVTRLRSAAEPVQGAA